MFQMIVRPEEFNNLDSLLKSVNEVLSMSDKSKVIFSFKVNSREDGYVFMIDCDSQSLHQLYFSDEDKLLHRIFGDLIMLQKPIDYRLFVVQWLARHTAFSQSEDMSIETKH